MARSCEDLRNNDPPDLENNPFLFSTFLKKEAIVNETSPVWKTFDSSSESVDHAPFPDLGSSSGRLFCLQRYLVVLYPVRFLDGLLNCYFDIPGCFRETRRSHTMMNNLLIETLPDFSSTISVHILAKRQGSPSAQVLVFKGPFP